MRLSLKRRKDRAEQAPAPQSGHRAHPEPPTNLPDYEPVESADALAEVAELMATNRDAHDPAIEKRIVQLRHEAFAQLDRRPVTEAPVIGGKPESKLPTPHGLPEVNATEISADALRDGILGAGSLLVRGLIDSERADRMREGIDRACQGRDAFMQGAEVADTTPWFDPFAPSPDYPPDAAQWNRMKLGGHAVWASDSPRMMFELADGFDEIGLTGIVTQYLGERPALSMNKSVLRRVSPDSGTDWHQDGAFLGKGIRTCNVWIALSRCGDVAPGLDVVARRYDEIVATGTEGALFPWAVSPQVVEETRDGADIARPVFEPGDALLFDHYCLHRTAVDPAMTERRYATETWCFASSVYPDKTVPFVL
jgi:hypothetical protein